MSLPQKIDQALLTILERREISREAPFWRVDEFVKDVIPSLRPRIVAALLQALRSSNPLVRRNAAIAFWGIQNPAIVPALPSALHAFWGIEECWRDVDYLFYVAENTTARVNVGERPRNRRRYLMVGPGVLESPYEFRASRDREYRERLRDDRSLQGLRDALSDPDPVLRILAVGAMETIKAGDAVRPIVFRRHDHYLRIRQYAARWRDWFKSKAVLPRLVEDLQHPDAIVRCAVARSLYDADDLAAAQGLFKAMWDPDQDVRYWAVRAQTLRRSPDAVTRLLATLQDPNYAIRRESARALGLIGNTAAVERLLAEVQCERIDEVRRSMFWALGEIAAARARAAETAKAVLGVVRPALIKMSAEDPSVIVRLQASEVLAGLGAEHNMGAGGDGSDLSDLAPLNVTLPQAIEELLKEKRLKVLTFCLVGEILYKSKKKVFKIGQMTKQLENHRKGFVISQTQLRNHLKDVRKLFKKCLPNAGFIFAVEQGQRGYEITSRWWRAWEIAMDTLNRKMPSGYDRDKLEELTDES